MKKIIRIIARECGFEYECDFTESSSGAERGKKPQTNGC